MSRHPLAELILAAGLVAAAPAATVRHYWNFDTGYDDLVGAADGTAGAEVTTAPGPDGSTAASFPASLSGGGPFTSAGYVDIDQSQTWSPGTVAFSMSYWYRIADDGGTDPRGIFDFGGNGGDGPQSLYIGASGNLAFRIDGSTGGDVALVPMTEDDLWHFVVANYTPGSGIEVHVDGFGIDGTSATLDFGSVILDPDQYIGAFNVTATAPVRGLNGAIDDVAIYEGTLSQPEIDGLFSGVLNPAQIPEPGSLLLFGLGAAGLIRRRR